MPHCVILYTPNVDAITDMGKLCRSLADTMLTVLDESGKQVSPTGGTRVLAALGPSGAVRIADGRRSIGHKVGLTSRAMQQASQIGEPDYGTLLDDMLCGPGDIPTARFIAPRVEVGRAFVLRRRLAGSNV